MAELKRQLGLLDSTMINVGTIIASAIFIVPSAIALQLHASLPTILVWIVGGLVSLLGALSVAELGAAMPEAGGQYVYLTEAYGPVWGYLYGWASGVVINPASIAAIARWWLRSANASCSSRLTCDSRAWFSPTRPVVR